MNKKVKIGLIILGIILFLILLNYSGELSFMNNYLSGTPDKTCTIDSDCAIKRTTCGYCDCGDAVNKDWNVFCPFRDAHLGVLCKMCMSLNYDFEIKCVQNQCQKI